MYAPGATIPGAVRACANCEAAVSSSADSPPAPPFSVPGELRLNSRLSVLKPGLTAAPEPARSAAAAVALRTKRVAVASTSVRRREPDVIKEDPSSDLTVPQCNGNRVCGRPV